MKSVSRRLLAFALIGVGVIAGITWFADDKTLPVEQVPRVLLPLASTLQVPITLKQVAEQSRALRRATERTVKKQRKEEGKGKGRESFEQKNRSDMTQSIENIMLIVGESDLEDRG